MAAAYATLVSALNIINNLHHYPRPPISLNIQQVESLTQKIHFLLDFLQGHNPHRDYSREADPLESQIADAAYAAEHAIESHILDQLTNNGENMRSDGLYEALEKVIQDMASIEEEAKQIQGRVGVQHQLPPDSSTSSSIPQQSIMVGADDVKFQMMDKLTSHCRDLQITSIVGMGGSGEMANSSSSSQSSQKIVRKPGNTNNPEGELRCDHNLPVEYFTSKTELNPFRRFYCCRFHHRWDDCGVWQWIDPELTSHYKAYFHNMLVQRNKARELVDLNGMKAQVKSLMLEASTLKEELALQIEAFRDLQKANTAMEGVMTHLQWKNRIFLIFMVVLSLWVFF